jgi:hypothetical protein
MYNKTEKGCGMKRAKTQSTEKQLYFSIDIAESTPESTIA